MTNLPSNVTKLIPKKKVGSQTPDEEKKKLRVAAYARVSTDHEEQETSYEIQVEYYTALIQNNPDWEFVAVYADEAVIIGLKPPSTNGRRFSPISITGHFPI